jgi:hypothetical protein
MSNDEPSDMRKFRSWVHDVDRMMRKKFAIDTTDAGLDDNQLRDYWSWEQSPEKFVDWFGEKYDLTTMSDQG